MIDISIIIPTYNYGSYITECLNSVIPFLKDNDEIIVVDDGSTDNTYDIVTSLFCQKLVYLRQNNSGPSAARNYGVSVAKNSHVIFLDADDILGEGQLDTFRMAAESNPRKVVYGPWIRFVKVSEGKIPIELHGKPDHKDLLKAWLLGWYVSPCALLWPREAVEKLGGFDLRFKANEDGEFAKRALIFGFEFFFCDSPPAWNRKHLDTEQPSLSDDRSEILLNQRFQVLKKIEKLMESRDIFCFYRKELAFAYYGLGKDQVYSNPEFARKCYREFRRVLPWGRPPGSLLNWIGVSILGLENKEKLARYFRKIWIKR